MNMLRLGIANDIDDLHKIREIGDAAQLRIMPEDGSGASAYAFSIEESQWDRANQVLTASHLYRTGDLHVFLYSQKISCDCKRPVEEEAAYRTWRLAVQHREALAKKNPYE